MDSSGDFKIVISEDSIIVIHIPTERIIYKIIDGSDTYTDVNYIWFSRNLANWIVIRDRSIKNIIFINLDTEQIYKFNTDKYFTTRVYYNLSSVSPDGFTLIINGSFGNYSYQYLIFDITDMNKIYPIDCGDLNNDNCILKDINTGFETISYNQQDIVFVSYKSNEDWINGKIYLSITIRKEHHFGKIIRKYCSPEYLRDHRYSG